MLGPDIDVVVNGTEGRGRTVKESADMGAQRFVDRLQATISPGGVGSTTVDGEPAWASRITVPASSLQETEDQRGRSLYARHRDIEYLVTFSGVPQAFNAAVANYEAVMDSWKWTN